MDKRRAWFFGCSFTEHLLPTGTTNIHDVPIEKYIPWTSRVCSHYGWKECNMGKGGSSNENILNTLIKYMSLIKDGDVVFLTDTIITRIEGVSQTGNDNKIITFNGDSIFDSPNDVDTELPIKKQNFKVFVNYLHDFIVKYEDTWTEYWISLLIGLADELRNRNVEVYFWSHRLWNTYPAPRLFNRITEETNGIVNDGHWGGIGNREFAEYMINRIDTKEYFKKSELTLHLNI